MVNLLLECNIPHNVVILKGKPFDHSQFHSQVIKTILIPRKPEYGIIAPSSPLPVCYSTPTSAGEKGSGAMTAQLPPTFSAAACELAQGFIPVLGITTLISVTKYSSIIYPVRSIIWYKAIDYRVDLHRVDLRSLASVPHHLPTPALTMPQKFSCILMILVDECQYQTLTEGKILQILQEKMLTKEVFQLLRDKVKLLLNSNSTL